MKYVALGIVCVCVGCTQPGSSDETKRDLMTVVLQYHQFVDANKVGPASRDELLSFRDPYDNLPGNAARSERCKAALQSDKYAVIWSYNVAEDLSRNSQLILAYHKDVPEQGGYVAFADGHAQILTAEEFTNTSKAVSTDSNSR